MVILTTLTVLAYGWMMRAVAVRNLLVVVVAAAVLLGPLYLVADQLPLAAQRALSVLPGLRIDSRAVADAQNSYFLRWEFEQGRGDHDPGLLLGGSRLHALPDEASLRTARFNMLEYNPHEGQFYKGFISQMVSTGVFGTVAILIFSFGGAALALTQIDRRLWVREAQEGEFQFHKANTWRQTEEFRRHSQEAFRAFWIAPGFLPFDKHEVADDMHPLELTEGVCERIFVGKRLRIQKLTTGVGALLGGTQTYGHGPYCMNYWLTRAGPG